MVIVNNVPILSKKKAELEMSITKNKNRIKEDGKANIKILEEDAGRSHNRKMSNMHEQILTFLNERQKEIRKRIEKKKNGIFWNQKSGHGGV